jgi:hypothetical protein
MIFNDKKLRDFFRRARRPGSSAPSPAEDAPAFAQNNASTPFAYALAGLCAKGLVVPHHAAGQAG